MTGATWWEEISGPTLAQGDLLRGCIVPIMPANMRHPAAATDTPQYDFTAEEYDLIVVTQSCDLEHGKARLVAACPCSSLSAYETHSPGFKLKGEWEQVRKGKREGLHLLAGVSNPSNNRDALVVDFRQIYSLPLGYLSNHAAELLKRPRLASPYLEHFSQAFARFFMRVGLPSSIPEYR